MRPDLTNGKGTGKSPALGINRGGSFVQRTHFLECLCPSAEVKSLVEISPCPCVSLTLTTRARVIVISNKRKHKEASRTSLPASL